MSQPGRAASVPYISKGQGGNDSGVQPTDQAPIRICDFKKSDWKKHRKRRERNQASDERPAIICGLWSLTSDLRIRPVFPAEPKKIECEKWNEPAITILLVDRPLV